MINLTMLLLGFFFFLKVYVAKMWKSLVRWTRKASMVGTEINGLFWGDLGRQTMKAVEWRNDSRDLKGE